MFGAFVMACGLTHLFAVWNIWHPDYWLDMGIKAITALISAITALALWRLMPDALLIPSRQELEHLNRELHNEVARRALPERELQESNRQLEQHIIDRTAELHFNNTILATLQENSPDAILLVGETGRILSYNQKFLHIWKLSPQLVKQGFDRPVIQAKLDQVQNPREFSARVSDLYENREEKSEDEIPLKDGRTLHRYSAPVSDESGRYLGRVWYFRDITERKQAEAKILRLSHLYEALSRCNKAIVHCENQTELFPLVCRAAVEYGGMKMAWIGLVDSASPMVTVAASYGQGIEYLDGIQISVDAANRFGRGPTGCAIRENKPFWCQDYQIDAATAPWRERGKTFGWGASAAIPLLKKGVPVGAFVLYAGEVNAFDSTTQNLLVEMARDIGFALDIFETEAKRKSADESLRKLSRAVEQSPASIVITDLDANIEYVNDAFTRVTGYSRDEVIGQNPRFLQSGKTPKKTHAEMWATLTRGEVWIGEIINKRKDESEYTELAIISPVRQQDGRITNYVGIKEDITERKRMESSLRASEERYRGLVEQPIAGTYIIQDGRYVYVNPRFAEILGYATNQELIGKDMMSLVAEKDRDKVRENVHQRLDGVVKSVTYSFTAIRKDGSTIEVEVHGARAEYEGRPALVGLIQDITEKQRAEMQIRRYVDQLENAFMRTVEVATTLSEMRDPYTAGHERRVGEIAVSIGKELGFSERRLEGLRVAGYLHDIGKITIPAEILAKPAKLNPAEYSLIQGHAQAGYEVLKNIEFPWPVAQVALQHHERLDGSGYPNGLKGDSILLEARIMSIADVIEAMASHRPYRAGLGIEKALAEIERGSGTVYDPVIVDACLRLFRERHYDLPS